MVMPVLSIYRCRVVGRTPLTSVRRASLLALFVVVCCIVLNRAVCREGECAEVLTDIAEEVIRDDGLSGGDRLARSDVEL